VGAFGKLEESTSGDDYYRIFKEAVFEVIGNEGTWIQPTFSYSFCWNKKFDIDKTPGICGFLSEMMRKDPESLRSEDANFSITAVGSKAEYITKNAPENPYAKEGFWDRFIKIDGKFCNFNFDAASTFIHYVERELKIHYRYDKPFNGELIKGDKVEQRIFYHFAYNKDNPVYRPDYPKFDRKAREMALAQIAVLGKGQIVCISAKDTFELIKKELINYPIFLIAGTIDPD
jgi:aminoglycoside 3-N-acetyltransferase